MCGRFTNRLTWREIVALYRLTAPATPERNLPARYNICPTQTIDAVIERDGQAANWCACAGASFRHGGKRRRGKPLRHSTLEPRLWHRSRCSAPRSSVAVRDPSLGLLRMAEDTRGKAALYYTAQDDSTLSFAGLWDEWKTSRLRTTEVLHDYCHYRE